MQHDYIKTYWGIALLKICLWWKCYVSSETFICAYVAVSNYFLDGQYLLRQIVFFQWIIFTQSQQGDNLMYIHVSKFSFTHFFLLFVMSFFKISFTIAFLMSKCMFIYYILSKGRSYNLVRVQSVLYLGFSLKRVSELRIFYWYIMPKLQRKMKPSRGKSNIWRTN